MSPERIAYELVQIVENGFIVLWRMGFRRKRPLHWGQLAARRRMFQIRFGLHLAWSLFPYRSDGLFLPAIKIPNKNTLCFRINIL